MSHDTCPTVQVQCDNEQGFYIINEEDFDSSTQKLFGDSVLTTQAEPVIEQTIEELKPWQAAA